MNRVLILLASALLLNSSAWSAGTLKVTSPNGGQKWTTGKSYAVKWNKGSAGKYVRIRLLKSGKHYRWITKKTPNDGRYVWKIPANVVASSNYKIRIQPYGKSGYDNSDRSFSISRSKRIILGNNNAELSGKSIGRGIDKRLWKTVPVMLDGKRAATAYIGRTRADSQTIYWSIMSTNNLPNTFYCFLELRGIYFYDDYGRLLRYDAYRYIDGSVGKGYSVYTDTCLKSGESGIFGGIELANGTRLYDKIGEIGIGYVDAATYMTPAIIKTLPLSYRTFGSYNEALIKVKSLKGFKTRIGFTTTYLLNPTGKPIYWDISWEGADITARETYSFAAFSYYRGSESAVRTFLDIEPTSATSSVVPRNVCSGPTEKKIKCLRDSRDDRKAQINRRLMQSRGGIEKVNVNWLLGE